jgi:hypothetical protein
LISIFDVANVLNTNLPWTPWEALCVAQVTNRLHYPVVSRRSHSRMSGCCRHLPMRLWPRSRSYRRYFYPLERERHSLWAIFICFLKSTFSTSYILVTYSKNIIDGLQNMIIYLHKMLIITQPAAHQWPTSCIPHCQQFHGIQTTLEGKDSLWTSVSMKSSNIFLQKEKVLRPESSWSKGNVYPFINVKE